MNPIELLGIKVKCKNPEEITTPSGFKINDPKIAWIRGISDNLVLLKNVESKVASHIPIIQLLEKFELIEKPKYCNITGVEIADELYCLDSHYNSLRKTRSFSSEITGN